MAELRRQLATAGQEIDQLRQKLRRATDARAQAEGKLIKAKADSGQAAAAAARDVARSITVSASETTMLGQLQRAEKRCAELLAQNRVLQAEVDGYKSFMESTVPRQKATIKKLKKEAKALRRKASM